MPAEHKYYGEQAKEVEADQSPSWWDRRLRRLNTTWLNPCGAMFDRLSAEVSQIRFLLWASTQTQLEGAWPAGFERDA